MKTFIIVDDDLLNNKVCSMVIERTLKGAVQVKTFSSPEAGLAFLQSDYTEGFNPSILLLDINMPTLTGWEFMERYAQFDEAVKAQISVYIVSSSVDQRDRHRAENDPLIKGFIPKPVESNTVLKLVETFA